MAKILNTQIFCDNSEGSQEEHRMEMAHKFRSRQTVQTIDPADERIDYRESPL